MPTFNASRSSHHRDPKLNLSPNRLPAPESTELLATEIADGFRIIYLGDVFEVARDESVEEPERADDVRLLDKAEKTL